MAPLPQSLSSDARPRATMPENCSKVAWRGEENNMSLNRISRRNALLALGVAATREARADGGLLRATRVDHVALAVGDIDKALVFYRALFGNEVLKDSRTARRYLRLGP